MPAQGRTKIGNCPGWEYMNFPGVAVFAIAVMLLLAGCNGSGDNDTGSGDDSPNPVFECDNDDLTDLQQELLDAHNAARAVARSCEAGGVVLPVAATLEWNCILAEAAFNHSEDMATVDFFNHIGSDGLDVADRVTNLGYSYFAVGENIAAGQGDVDSVMAGWLSSRGHCLNIMSGDYTQLGAARVESTTAEYDTYWTVVFARPY
jgi:uncharacterized protein YkwD